jgi:hypothetical protein
MAGAKASEIADNARETYQHVKDTVGKTVDSVRGEDSNTGRGTRGLSVQRPSRCLQWGYADPDVYRQTWCGREFSPQHRGSYDPQHRRAAERT